MPKATVVNANAPAFGTESSAGLPGIFGASAPSVSVMFQQHKNPDGTPVLDTRK